MFLAVDIGNTDTVIGVFEGDRLLRHWRVSTSGTRTPDEYGVLALNLISSAGINPAGIEGAAACSVVPAVNRTIGAALLNYLGVRPLFVGTDMDPGIAVLTDNP